MHQIKMKHGNHVKKQACFTATKLMIINRQEMHSMTLGTLHSMQVQVQVASHLRSSVALADDDDGDDVGDMMMISVVMVMVMVTMTMVIMMGWCL